MRSMLWARFLFLLLLSPAFLQAQDDGFVPIFDGKTLEGWDGNPDFWSVEDGAITGHTTAEKPTKGNTFIIWRGGEVGDFEFKCEYKIINGNSGIQYRSFEVPNEKWVVGGYQADFEAGNTYSGINYGERFRGILANRGQKTIIKQQENGSPKVEVVEQFGDSKEIQTKIKKEDWNEYTISGKGYTFEHKINGVTTSICTDEHKDRRASGILALQLHAGPPMKVQFRNIMLRKLDAPAGDKGNQGAQGEKASGKKKIVFLAGGPSHGFGAHDHLAGCKLLAASLEKHLGYTTEVHYKDWPKDLTAYDGADCVVMYSDGGGGHPANSRLQVLDEVAKKGIGIVCLHYAVEVPKGESGDKFLDWIGGYFETHWSVNPHWVAEFKSFPDHPICRGVEPFKCDDEWYYHMRFRPEMQNVTPILSALPPKETLNRGDGPHSGNPDVRADVLERKQPQHVAWAATREGGGRGFGFTGGHNHWNWGDDNFRKVVLNAITWCAQGEVPAKGVSDNAVSLDDLLQNPDEQIPANFDKKRVVEKFNLKTTATQSIKKTGPAAKPVFASSTITTATPGHATEISADITGAKQLFLVVTDGGDGFGCDWANWAEPRLIAADGKEKKLTELKWKSAMTGHGAAQLNKNCEGKPMKINGKEVEYGIGVHANAVIAYDLPDGFTKFKARGGLDNGGSGQGCGSTVEFLVYTQQPPTIVTDAKVAASNSAIRDAENAIAGLDVADGLEATLFSSEPQISNITSIDIDAQGRIWACEVKNYRKWKDSRPEGDRILVLEDTNQDGKADKQTVFYQGRDIDSAHGICVLGNRVLVSAGDKIISFYDDNGDLKSDRKENLFTGIAGTQHDHGIHAMMFGPDGKLYFNFGNSGSRLMDKDGKPVKDLAGNEINSSRKPYQEGMVFRCDLDGSNVETLGWNFRNNWEATTDSFGSIWQSDNDDDGNKGVRINFVMEFGNYGYKDEFTGAGWQQKRENMEKEIPERHWHLNDPGVVPNLLLTGAGSPTGICVYEGRLLPKVFWDQVIHCDAGPNVCRAYPAKKSGAGYTAEMINVLHGKRDNWFRPSDVCTAPDGSIFVADWYDPGVGGHNQQDVDRGRIFRLAPPGSKYEFAKCDVSTIEGAIAALQSPCLSTRYEGFTALQAKGADALPALKKLASSTDNPRIKARSIWLQGKIAGNGPAAVKEALADKDPDIRIVGVRLARQLNTDVAELKSLANDSAPEVRRELCVALHHSKSPAAPELWAQLAQKYEAGDRWYLEALGIAADGNWDACLEAWLKTAGSNWDTPAGRDIAWRSRGKKSPELLAQILKNPETKEEDQARYFRAFDFLSGPEKEAALKSIVE